MPPISEALRALSGSRVQDLGLERTFSESRLNVNCDSSLLHFFRDFFAMDIVLVNIQWYSINCVCYLKHGETKPAMSKISCLTQKRLF